MWRLECYEILAHALFACVLIDTFAVSLPENASNCVRLLHKVSFGKDVTNTFK